ncbi:unnamed protein product, partial [Bemisia tabaci]
MSRAAVAAIIYPILFILCVVPLFFVPASALFGGLTRGKSAPPQFKVEDEYETVRGHPEKRSKKFLNNKEMLWKSAVVIYKASTIGCPSSFQCLTLMDAMSKFSQNTCVRFKEWTGETDYVDLVLIDSSTEILGGAEGLGRKGGKQLFMINKETFHEFVILHELGHVLGLIDEVRRPDRDNFIDVFPNNIRPDQRHFFQKHNRTDVNLLGKPFDHESIMLYASGAGAKGGILWRHIQPAYKSKSHGLILLQNLHLSHGDIHTINDLYRCRGTNQKPRFPVDVICDFGHNDCGFKCKYSTTWQWINSEVAGIASGFLVSKPRRWSYHSSRGLWSVNFYGLSPLDVKRRRRPKGCIIFKYLFHILEPKLVALKVSVK